MNRKLFSVLVVAVMLMQLLCGFSAVSAADADKTVVFVKDDGTGDGSSPENAAPTLMDAYNYLDLSKDCTVVICGPCTLWEAFDYGAPYEGSVTITSVYNGIDWRAANDAVLQVMYINIVWRGDTTLSYMDLECISDKGVHIDCQFNDFTIDYGVNIIGDHLSGLTDSSSIFVVGGYQSGKGEYVAGESPLDRDVNLKFYSGYNILVNIWSRGVSNETYTGKATVLFSGTSEGSVFVAGLKTSGCTFGDTDLIIEDEALVYNIYGTASVDANEKSFDCYWYGGELLTCIDSYRNDGKFITFLEGRKLYASDAAKQGAVYDEISAWFDTVESVTAPEVPEHTPP
ncbi:MAG: hypothetical protein IJN63_02595, partial [Clostridia bacterium]|nr:hypothetical protein [Clostridia bacterium]